MMHGLKLSNTSNASKIITSYMVGKLLVAFVTIVNAGSKYLISVTGFGVSIRFTVTEHSLRVREEEGLSEMVCLQPFPQMIGYIGPIFNFW